MNVIITQAEYLQGETRRVPKWDKSISRASSSVHIYILYIDARRDTYYHVQISFGMLAHSTECYGTNLGHASNPIFVFSVRDRTSKVFRFWVRVWNYCCDSVP